MGERISAILPFAIAVLLPPAGVLLGLVELQNGHRAEAMRLIAIAVLAAVVWVLLFIA